MNLNESKILNANLQCFLVIKLLCTGPNRTSMETGDKNARINNPSNVLFCSLLNSL